jgi:hypothetical protein
MNHDTSIEARFEGHEVVEAGTATIPHLLLWHYRDLGLVDAQFTLLTLIIARKWTREAPYPSLARLPMTANLDSRRRYVRDLRQKGLIFTSRLYWTNKDIEGNPSARPGRVRSNIWYLGSLFHNLVRIHRWLHEGNPAASFCVEIPLTTIKMFLKGDFHDTPEYIINIINQQTQGGVVLKTVTLPCEKRTVGKSTMRFSSSSFSSSRKTHSHEEESESKKNQKKKKNKVKGADAPPLHGRNNLPAEVAIKTRVKEVFCLKTGLSMPRRKTDQNFWWSNFGEIASIAEQNIERAEWLVEEVITYMTDEHLTISGPQSIVNLCRSLAAGQVLAKGGTKKDGQTRRSNIKGLRENGSDNPIKPIFDPDTGEDYYVDARSGQRVHPDGCPCYGCHPEHRPDPA